MPMRLLVLSSIQLGNRDDMTQWVVLCIGVLATLYLVMRGRTRAARRQDPMARAASVGMGLAQQRQVERDISNLMVEMLETARQMTAQLDTRAARLEALIGEADAKIEALRGAAVVANAPPAPVEALPAPEPSDDVEKVAAAKAPPMAPEPKPETPPDPRHAEVYALADEGRSPGEIARSLNRPNGEVELILALRRG
jgi:hypothetical protein